MPATPTWSPAAPGLKEASDSGEFFYGDVVALTKIYQGKYEDCIAGALPKGTVGSGDTYGFTVQSSKVTKTRGEIGNLVIQWVGFEGIILPADEFFLQDQELNPMVEKNKAFGNVTPQQMALIRAAVFTADKDGSLIAQAQIAALGSSSSEVETKQLFALMSKGVTSFYKAYFTYHWTQYFTTEPSVSAGGYIETPGGPLSSLVSGLGLTCLRIADSLKTSNGFYARTRKWMCAPDSHWDAVLYS